MEPLCLAAPLATSLKFLLEANRERYLANIPYLLLVNQHGKTCNRALDKEVDGKSHLQNDIFEKPSKEISIVARYVVHTSEHK